MPRYLTKRDGWWHYARRVPDDLRPLDRRGVVKQSTKIRVEDDPRGLTAEKVAARINKDTEDYWRDLSQGEAVEAKERYKAARRRARLFGFDYAPADELIAQRSTAELLARISAVVDRKSLDMGTVAASVLGTVKPPQVTLSNLFDEFKSLVAVSMRDFSEDQLRKWRNPRVRAIENLMTVIGDRPVAMIRRGDALDFRVWWQDRILEEGLMIETANRDIGHLSNMLRTVDEAHQLGLDQPFANLRIAGGRDGSRAPFDAEFLQTDFLAEGALDSLNEEARAVIYLMVETGLRLVEACNLTGDTIVLDTNIPHVKVRADGRRLKTSQSERDIPLLGVSLMAARAFPNGFPTYRHKADALSAIANKQLAAAGLRPEQRQSAYSLRHSFEDRLTAIEAPEKLIAALMGHKYQRPKYGAGPSLDQKLKWLEQVAFSPPARI